MVLLNFRYDENYEPTQEGILNRSNSSEILEYAQFLGMDTSKEQDLFWIARESLKAPLPSEWKPRQ
jgi:centrosomal protein CEP164